MMRIVRNCAMDSLRRQKSQAIRHQDEHLRAGSVADPVARAELDAALSAITPQHREPFLLIEVFGLSYAEASDVLGVRIGTVKSRMHRARQALCRALADDEDAEEAR
jgi:RNA polymerase sigma factor (sigma-70 family)